MGQSATPESAPSCRNIYVASAEGDTGKSAIALGLLALGVGYAFYVKAKHPDVYDMIGRTTLEEAHERV